MTTPRIKTKMAGDANDVDDDICGDDDENNDDDDNNGDNDNSSDH